MSEPTVVVDFGQERARRGTTQTTFVFGGFKKTLTQSEAAAYDLRKALNAYPDIPASLREEFKNRIVDMPQLIYMNKVVMAASLYLLYVSNYDLDQFQANFEELFISVLPRFDLGRKLEAQPLVAQKYREMVLRYVRAILSYVDLVPSENNTS